MTKTTKRRVSLITRRQKCHPICAVCCLAILASRVIGISTANVFVCYGCVCFDGRETSVATYLISPSK